MDIYFNQKTFDIDIVDGAISMITTDQDLLLQRLYNKFKTFKRDLFWNITYGIDYLNDVFGLNMAKNIVDLLFTNEIKKEPLVKELVSYTSSIDRGTYSCRFEVNTVEMVGTIVYYLLSNENGLVISDGSSNEITVRI